MVWKPYLVPQALTSFFTIISKRFWSLPGWVLGRVGGGLSCWRTAEVQVNTVEPVSSGVSLWPEVSLPGCGVLG